MPDKCPDIYQCTISLSCFFPLIHTAAENISLPLIPTVWMSAECHTNFQTVSQCELCGQTMCAMCVATMCGCTIVLTTHRCAGTTTVIYFVFFLLCACAYTNQHKSYPQRDKSNPLPGGAQGSSIDRALSGCWWTSRSDKVYHSDLSHS